MARTRRRHSYRKSRRWNPEIAPGFKAALASTPAKSTGYASVAAAPLVNPRGHRGHRRKARHSHTHHIRGGGKWGFARRGQQRGKGKRGRWLANIRGYNPRGRSTRSSRARSWNRKVRESVPWWSKGRNPRSGHKKTRSAQARRRSKIRKKTWWSKGRNPRKGSYYGKRRHTRRNPRKGSYARRYLKKLSPARRKHVVSYALGSMNPRRSRTRRGRR